MKHLTYSTIAAARLRANQRQYLSLVLGIFLSIFLVSTLVLSVYGIYQAELQKRYDKVGYLDMVILDNSIVTDEEILAFDEFDRLGHAYISGIVTDRNVYVGYYDEVGMSLMNLEPIEGRLPEKPGEIALERSAMDVLEADWQIGDSVELAITPVDGVEETRCFTVVGILPERAIYLSVSDHNGLRQFPAIVTSPDEPAFAVGRLGIHYLMGLAPHAALDQAIQAVWAKIDSSDGNWNIASEFFGLSISGEQRQWSGVGDILDADKEMVTLIFIAATLGVSLILSCGVGISGAMESVLSKRREEIGVLRALGATRRQIRRMFGRENLILAAIVSPLSILISIGAVWILSMLLPGSLKFAVNLWLILPIALFSLVVILISGYLPLVRASKMMPMGVIRDTAMLRRSKGLHPKREFSVPRLIAARQVRFHPTRQIGASLLVGLMLLSSGLLTALSCSYQSRTVTDPPAFYINSDGYYTGSDHISFYHQPSMDKQSISQLRNLPHVKELDLNRQMYVTLLTDQVPRYAYADLYEYSGMLDDEQFQEALSIYPFDTSFHEQVRATEREAYLQFRKDYGISGEAFAGSLVTIELNGDTLNQLKEHLESGKINVDAINAGSEVIVLAPQIWMKSDTSGGYHYWDSEEAVNKDPDGEGAVLVAWNDTFTAGQSLPLLNLYRTEENGTVFREDANVTIGAVASTWIGSLSGRHDVCVLTTEQGLENMGLRMDGLTSIEVYLDGTLSIEEEEILERQIQAITRRTEGYTVSNRMEYYRQQEQSNQQTLILLFCVVTVFFTAAVGMIVSSVTRQLQSEGRTIGMLRAVGADEKTILGCYSGQVIAGMAGGIGISLGLLLVNLAIYLVDALKNHYTYMLAREGRLLPVMAVTICVMGAVCCLVCRYFLRFRIREIIRKSIIDNIREL